jgi:integrase
MSVSCCRFEGSAAKNVHYALIVAQGTGMRPSEIFQMRVENLDFANRQLGIPLGKRRKSRRFAPLSERMAALLTVCCAGRNQGAVASGRIFGRLPSEGAAKALKSRKLY